MRTILKAAIGAALAFTVQATPASAQFLTFVSATGNDANTCFIQANPCKTLQRAINQTSPGGELRLLSSLVSNGFINKSITIEGGRNTVIGTLAVNNASAIVRFRRINLNGVHAFPTGFNLINAAAVHIEECSVERFASHGVHLDENISAEIFLSGTTVRDGGGHGLQLRNPSTAIVTIEDSSFRNNLNRGVILQGTAKTTFVRTTFFGNFDGLNVTRGTLVASEVMSAANDDTGFESSNVAEATLTSCDAVGNGGPGLDVGAGVAAMRLSECVSTANGTGLLNAGTALTLDDNLIPGNTTNVSGTLTPLTPE